MRTARYVRKTLDAVAGNNEAAALEVMRALERLSDEVLRQRLLNIVHRLNQDAAHLRQIRDEVQSEASRLA